jgi:very-short-patch-repair endonuclease
MIFLIMAKKLNYKYIANNFKDNQCILLESEYINSHTKMQYICSCGNISYITWDHFRRGERCKNCGITRTHLKQKHNYEYVFNYFKIYGCELLENKYINNETKMQYKCSCGAISYITFNHFQEGHRCKDCGIKKIVDNKTLSFEYVYNEFKKYDCELLSKKYKTSKDKLKYKCKCGNIGYISFDNFSHGHRCIRCAESFGEKKINDYLIRNNYNFERQYKINECKNIRPLPFDFYLLDYNICIEYDGEQHFECVDYFGGEIGFKKCQLNDSIKTNYCQSNNIPLLRILYTEFKNIEQILDNFLLSINNQIEIKQEIG